MEVNEEKKRIITEAGLFYSNFDRFKFNLFLMPDSDCYSENLVRLRDEYGIVVGEQQPDSAGQTHENTIGVYIVDYPRYLRDLEAGYKTLNEEEQELPDQVEQSGPRL